MPIPIEEIQAKFEMEERLKVFCRGCDRNDVDLMLSAFHPDAMADYGYMKGTAREFSEWVVQTHEENFTHTTHELSNMLISLDGDRATSEAYMDSRLRYKDGDGFSEVFTSVRYLGKWERRNDIWKMVHHMALCDRFRTIRVEYDEEIAHWFAKLPQSTMDKNDISYEYIKRATA